MNPYAPPSSFTPAQTTARLRLFTPLAVSIHTFITPPWIGAVLATVNYRRLKNNAGVSRTFLVFVLPALAVHAGSFLLPPSWTLFVSYRLATLVLAALLYRDQKPIVTPELAAGALPARWYFGWMIVAPIALVAFFVIWQWLAPR
jgi:hypothetical protein